MIVKIERPLSDISIQDTYLIRIRDVSNWVIYLPLGTQWYPEGLVNSPKLLLWQITPNYPHSMSWLESKYGFDL